MCNDNYIVSFESPAASPAEDGRIRLRMGFSLIEVLVVVIIISIAAIVAVPMFSSADSLQIHSAAEIIAADLEYAKSMAITTGQNYSVVFDTATDSYKIMNLSKDPINPIDHPATNKKFGYVENFKQDSRLSKVNITSVQFQPGANNTITFDSMGMPYSGNSISSHLDSGSITISGGGTTTTITVEPVTGYISIN